MELRNCNSTIALSFSVICILNLGLMAQPLQAALLTLIISLAIYGEASAFRLFGHQRHYKKPIRHLAKSRCHFTYELVQVVTYDTHYDEVRRYQNCFEIPFALMNNLCWCCRSATTITTRNVIWSTTSVLNWNTEGSASQHFVRYAQNYCIPCTSKNAMMTQGKNAIKKMGIMSVTLLLLFLLVTRDVTTVTNAMVKSAVGLWTNGLSKNVKMIKILQQPPPAVLVKKQTAGK